MRGFLRLLTLLARGRIATGGQLPPPPPGPRLIVALAEPAEYVNARAEAAAVCRQLGLDIVNEHWDTAGIADFIRLAYAGGSKACESRLASPDTADAIYLAITSPGALVEREYANENVVGWTVRAVQQAVAYGVPKART